MQQLRRSTLPAITSTNDGENPLYRRRSKSLPAILSSKNDSQKASAVHIKRVKSELSLSRRHETELHPFTHKTGYLKDEEVIRQLSHSLNNLPSNSVEFHQKAKKLKGAISLLRPWKEIKPEAIKFPKESIDYFKEYICKEVMAICHPIEAFPETPSTFDWNAEENEHCRKTVEATKQLFQQFNKKACPFIDAAILTYDLYHSAYNETLQLLSGHLCDLNIRPTQQTKRLDIQIPYRKKTTLFAGTEYLHRLLPDITPEIERIHPNLVTIISNLEEIISGRMNIYFSLSRRGYQILCDYIKTNGATDVIEVMAGTGYNAAHIQKCGLTVDACDAHPKKRDIFFPVKQADAIRFIEDIASSKTLDNSALLICAPPPRARTSDGVQDIAHYMTNLYKACYDHGLKLVILFSECCDEQVFHRQDLLSKENIMIKTLSSLPDALLEDAGEFAGIAKAFQIIPLEQKQAEAPSKTASGIGIYIGDDPENIIHITRP
ncbi:hypothetical protein GCM10023116_50270 [Kistimonas scapharcae]|uniref:Methyltransferase n=1 Tax=Kistimonas scapharcae TaxID=1036133 RepID=A0ABP8V8Z7_9GAMM